MQTRSYLQQLRSSGVFPRTSCHPCPLCSLSSPQTCTRLITHAPNTLRITWTCVVLTAVHQEEGGGFAGVVQGLVYTHSGRQGLSGALENTSNRVRRWQTKSFSVYYVCMAPKEKKYCKYITLMANDRLLVKRNKAKQNGACFHPSRLPSATLFSWNS